MADKILPADAEAAAYAGDATGAAVPTTQTHAETQSGGHHEEALLLGIGAENWVSVSMFIFFALAIIIGKLPQRIAAALDDRIAGVRRQLDEAKAIRTEAEALLIEAAKARDAATRDAADIVARAESEAVELVKESRRAAEFAIERRTAAAEAKIAAAERAAEADLRADVARRVTAAAATLIAANADKKLQTRLADEAIAGLERRLH